MARIAGIEAAEATDYMTAALRGFNMELNETSAQRINDVYSKLAAITASNTQEISVAMTKVASLANNANMEFETTAAFLSQIVETTRESAETAGTALKTVIARFSEVKQLYSEGELMGTDEEGMEIDVNKISTALRTAGINLNEYFTGMKGLDEIFLELAQKWDSLTSVQQRYIATQAAGSRQQSRFIAMMSNYDRTVELVNAANNSAGASQEQFNKTLESMETLLAKLKNAWNEFTMGIANNEVLKTGVKILTTFLNILNSITNVLPGVASGFAKIALAWGGLKAGRAIFNSLLSSFGRAGKEGAISFRQSFQKEFGGKRGIFSIISNEIFANKTDKYYAKLTPAINKYAASQRQVVLTQKLSNSARKEGVGVDVLSAKATTAAAAAERDRAQAISLLSSYYGLENAQAEQALAITTLGINSDVAAAAAKNNLTQEMVEEMIVAKMNAGATREEAAAKVEETLAEQYADSIRKKSLLSRLASIIHTKAQTVAEKAETGSLKKNIAAWLAKKTAIDATNKSKLLAISLTTGLAAGIAAAVAGLILFVKWASNQTAEKRLEKIQDTAKKAGEAADTAAESYDNLKSSLDKLQESYNGLKELTRGTQEWRDALIDINNEVLNLIEDYPELLKYIKTENGMIVLDINSDEVQDVLKEYENAKLLTTGVKAAADANVIRGKVDVYYENLENKIQSQTDTGYSLPTDSEYMTKKIAIMLASGELTDRESVNEYLRSASERDNYYNYASIISENTIDNLRDFGKYLIQSEQQIENFNNAISVTSMAIINANGELADAESEYAEKLMSSEFVQRVYNRRIASMGDYDSFTGAEKDAYEEYFSRIYGSNVEIGSSGEVTYKDESGEKQTFEEEQAMSMYAAAKATEDVAEYTSNILNLIQRRGLTKEQSNLLITALTGNATNLTPEEYRSFIDNPDFLKTLGLTLPELGYLITSLGYTDTKIGDLPSDIQKRAARGILGENATEDEILGFIEQHPDAIADAGMLFRIDLEINKERIEDQWDSISSIMSSKYIEESFYKDWDIGIIKNVSKQIEGFAPEQAQTYVKKFNEVIKDANLGEEVKKNLESYISTVDWSSMTDAMNAFLYMVEQGVDINKLQSFWNNAISAAKTYVSTASEALGIMSLIRNKYNQADELQGRLISGEATDEDIQNLIDAGVLIEDIIYSTSKGWGMAEKDAINATDKMRKNYLYSIDAMWGAQQQFFEDTQKRLGLSVSWDAKEEKYTMPSFDELGITKANAKDSKKLKSLADIFGLDISSYDGDTDRFFEDVKTEYDKFYNYVENKSYIDLVMNQAKIFAEASSTKFEDIVPNYTSDQAIRLIAEQAVESADADIEAARTTSDILEKSLGNIAYIVSARNSIIAKGFNDLVESYNDWTNAIDKNSGKFKRDTSENIKIAKEFGEAIGNMLSFDEYDMQFIDEFIDSIDISLVEEAINGNKEAFVQLQKEAAKFKVLKFNIDDDLQEKIFNIIDNLKIPDLKIGTILQDDQFFIELYNMLNSAGRTVDEINGIFEKMGFEVRTTGGDIMTMTTPDGRFTYDVTGTTKVEFVSLGTGGISNSVASSSGGGGGSNNEWENPYDWLYNLTEEINKKLREREKLERRYNKLVEGRKATAAQLLETSDLELKNLENQSKLQSEMLAKRKQEMEKELSEYSDMSKYASYDFENGLIQIDWDLIDSVTDTEEGERIEEYISKLEEIRDEIQSAEDAMDDIEDQIDEINERGKDEYTSLEEKIKDAIINARQEEIDRLSAINDAINDTNSKLIDSMQKAIDQQRQDRENEKTEEEIAEKQRRLVYLQQDTSGANALEILQLQDEISEAQESYTDQLIDQKISELQEQNDAAAEQRERQIEILQSQLEYDEKYGVIASQTTQAIKDLIEGGSGGVIVNGTSLAELLMRNEDFAAMTSFAQAEWWADLQTQASLATLYYKQQLATYGNRDFSAEIMEALSKGDYKLAAELEQLRNYKIDLLGLDYEKTYSYATGDWSQWESQSSSEQKPSAPTEPQTPPSSNTPTVSESDKKKVAAAIWHGGLGWGSGTERSNKLTEVFGSNNGIQNMVNQGIGKNDRSDLSEYTYTKMRKKYKGYKTGGLADYTGPAWLDGTPSKPEIILNQKDSQNFIELKDILSSLMGYSSKRKAESNGDNYYDIDINVESIGSDYDIERAAEKIKTMIRDDAMYRNVNAINNMR